MTWKGDINRSLDDSLWCYMMEQDFFASISISTLLLHFLSLNMDLCLVSRCVDELDDLSLELLTALLPLLLVMSLRPPVVLGEAEESVRLDDNDDICLACNNACWCWFGVYLPVPTNAAASNTSRLVSGLKAHVST